MKKSCSTTSTSSRNGERGAGRLKFLIVISAVVIVAYIGYQYVPVAFQSYQYRDFMQQSVDKGAALGKSSDWIKDQLIKNGAEYGVPANANITIQEQEGAVQARVQFKKPIEMVAYTYDYEFDKTVKSSSLWSIK